RRRRAGAAAFARGRGGARRPAPDRGDRDGRRAGGPRRHPSCRRCLCQRLVPSAGAARPCPPRPDRPLIVREPAAKSTAIAFTVNGQPQELLIKPGTTLLHTLRDALELYGAKAGCEGGNCGACTVHVDGVPILACCTATELVEGASITTIEGLAA